MSNLKITTIPKGWKKYILKDSVQFLRGSGLSKDQVVEGGKYKCVLYGELYTKYKETIKEVQSRTNSVEGTKSRNGDVVLPSSTTTKGIDLANAVAINEDNVLLGGDIIIIRDENKIYNNYYFAHYLTHKRKKDIERLTQGTTIIHLYSSGLKNLEIILPPVQEQNKIAEILSKVDEDIEKTDKIIQKTEKLKKGLMQELLTKGIGHKKFKKTEFGKNPEEWKIAKISEISHVTSSKRVMMSEYVESGIFFYRSKEIIQKSKNIRIIEPLYISCEKYNDFKSRFGAPKKGDILITAVGTLGIAYLVRDEKFYFKDGNLLWLRSIRNVDHNFLLQYFRSKIFKNFLDKVTIGSSQKALTIEKLSNVKILLPTKSEQKQIAEILSLVDEKIEVNKQIKNKLTQLKKGLMNDLLSGRVRV